jgi:NTP pyrophosphatase (non-canonical NTP hydrolase)
VPSICFYSSEAQVIPFALKHLMLTADARYGNFASTHEAMGVALEEWDELKSAVHKNNLLQVQMECLDLAAVVLRLANQLAEGGPIVKRSEK